MCVLGPGWCWGCDVSYSYVEILWRIYISFFGQNWKIQNISRPGIFPSQYHRRDCRMIRLQRRTTTFHPCILIWTGWMKATHTLSLWIEFLYRCVNLFSTNTTASHHSCLCSQFNWLSATLLRRRLMTTTRSPVVCLMFSRNRRKINEFSFFEIRPVMSAHQFYLLQRQRPPSTTLYARMCVVCSRRTNYGRTFWLLVFCVRWLYQIRIRH